MFKRRRDITDWPVRQIASQTVACFTSDPDEFEVRAAVALHLDPSLLPKDVESVAFNVFGFAFDHDDRVGLYMDVDPTVLVKMHEGAETLDEAEQLALGWCGEEHPNDRFATSPASTRSPTCNGSPATASLAGAVSSAG